MGLPQLYITNYVYITLLLLSIRLSKLKRVDAAKELFNAFATRTQAYKLHHAFGLTIFDHTVDMRLALTKNVENFEVLCISCTSVVLSNTP